MIGRLRRRVSRLLGRGGGPALSPWLRKHNALDVAIGFTISNNVVGDYYEFGVFRGESFIHAYHFQRTLYERYRNHNPAAADLPFFKQHVRFFAFDSFEGLPVVNDPHVPVHWAGDNAMTCDRGTFTNNLLNGKVDLADVVMVEGYYDKSLTADLKDRHRMGKAAIVHVDCDLYESTVTVLDYVTPFLSDGTVLVFDDWFYYQGHPRRGERGAFNAWLEKHPELIATELCKFPPAAVYIINFE